MAGDGDKKTLSCLARVTVPQFYCVVINYSICPPDVITIQIKLHLYKSHVTCSDMCMCCIICCG